MSSWCGLTEDTSSNGSRRSTRPWTRLADAKGSETTATLAMAYCILAANVFYLVQLLVLAVATASQECGSELRGTAGAAEGFAATSLLSVVPSLTTVGRSPAHSGDAASSVRQHTATSAQQRANPLLA